MPLWPSAGHSRCRMGGVSSKVVDTSHTAPASLKDVLHEAPRLYELLPCSSRQLLSATCLHLHKWIRKNVSCITIGQANELSHLAPKGWPHLAGVLLHKKGNPAVYFDSERLSTEQWHLDAEIRFHKAYPCDVLLLISLYDQV